MGFVGIADHGGKPEKGGFNLDGFFYHPPVFWGVIGLRRWAFLSFTLLSDGGGGFTR